jgi:hypothetical protein
MILLLSGEGPGDIGVCANGGGECEGGDFRAGPMTMLIDQLVHPIWQYSPLDLNAFVYASEALVSEKSRQIRGVALPGLKRPKGTAYFFKNARALARLAISRTATHSPVGAVLFRDGDGTRSAAESLWREKLDSIVLGFKAESFKLGVPMVPKPKSEVWLLCALQNNPYNNCARFEEVSGNDASPKSAKSQLNDVLERTGRGYNDICQMIATGIIRAESIQMPSYDCFRRRLEEVVRAMAGIPPA